MRSSIRRRILILSTLTVVVVSAIVGAVDAWQTERVLRGEFDESLRSSAVASATRLEDDEGQVAFELELAMEALAPIWGETAVVIVDRSGRVVFSSVAQDDSSHVLERSRPSEELNTPSWFDLEFPGQKTKSRFVQLTVEIHPITTDDEEPIPVRDPPLRATIFVGRPVTGLEHAIGGMRWTLGSVLIAAAFAALAGGYFVATAGTREIRVVAERIANVKAESPKLEINERSVPIELLPMVQTTQALLLRIDEELSHQRRLTADVAHDLRTPLAGVRTLLDVCLRRERSTPEYVETISQALAALRQTSTMLDNVLTLSRLDADMEQPQFQRVDIARVLNDAIEALAPMATQRSVVIRPSSGADQGRGPSGPHIDTDPVFLMKILVNLLSNAIEHSPPGGSVQIRQDLQDGRIEIKVGDQGPGVQPEMRERIFERFFRTDAARSAASGHQGLGLPISRGLAQLMGGDVRLDQSGESGSVFTIKLPRFVKKSPSQR